MRLGCVKYLNARPLIHGWPSDQVTLASPSELCGQLAAGRLDAALVSSFEFLRRPIYRIVDDVAIAAEGPVYSVIVAHQQELSRIGEIELDPASQTSVNLLRCLLAAEGFTPRLVAKSQDSMPARLLIGDQAIRFRQSNSQYQFWDLGQAWTQLTDLPFVFALWLVRPEVADPQSLANALRERRDQNLADIDRVIGGQQEFTAGFCRRYYSENLTFVFGPRHQAGLHDFARRCAKLGLIRSAAITLDLI